MIQDLTIHQTVIHVHKNVHKKEACSLDIIYTFILDRFSIHTDIGQMQSSKSTC